MVYRGKPSAACAECRKRRSRCDRAVPSCGQCMKAHRICSGYRNAVDLMFHDQSNDIVRKNSAEGLHKVRVTNAEASTRTQANVAITHSSPTPPLKITDFVLYQPLEDVGFNFFMSTYVGNDPDVSILYFLPKLYASTGYKNPGLQQCITATGLASWAKATGERGAVALATKNHLRAIGSINSALSHPKTARQESTLMAIAMMAMFEALIAPNGSGIGNFRRHLEGAMTVALLHAQSRNGDSSTLDLLVTLAYSVIVNCWIQTISLPAALLKLKEDISDGDHSKVLHVAFLDIVADLVQFREDIRSGKLKAPDLILQMAVALDRRFLQLTHHASLLASYQKFRVPAKHVNHMLYQGYYHVYNDRFVGHIWNNLRSNRLFLHQIIIQQYEILIPTSNMEQRGSLHTRKKESEQLLSFLATEIVASIPQLAGVLTEVQNRLALSEAGFMDQLGIENMLIQFRELDSRSTNHSSGSIEFSRFWIYNPSAGTERKRTQSPDSTSLSSSLNEEDHLISMSMVQPASLYHLLFQLYGIQNISILRTEFKNWVQGCISWLEGHTDPVSLARVQCMARRGADAIFLNARDQKPTT